MKVMVMVTLLFALLSCTNESANRQHGADKDTETEAADYSTTTDTDQTAWTDTEAVTDNSSDSESIAEREQETETDTEAAESADADHDMVIMPEIDPSADLDELKDNDVATDFDNGSADADGEVNDADAYDPHKKYPCEKWSARIWCAYISGDFDAFSRDAAYCVQDPLSGEYFWDTRQCKPQPADSHWRVTKDPEPGHGGCNYWNWVPKKLTRDNRESVCNDLGVGIHGDMINANWGEYLDYFRHLIKNNQYTTHGGDCIPGNDILKKCTYTDDVPDADSYSIFDDKVPILTQDRYGASLVIRFDKKAEIEHYIPEKWENADIYVICVEYDCY